MKDGFRLRGHVKWEKTVGGILVAQSPWIENQIVANAGRGIYIALDRLAGINDYAFNISHAEIGDDDTEPSIADTALGNGLERVSVGAIERSGLEVQFRFFFPDATTADDTYEEFGMYTDGAAGLGTGRLFNHLLFGDNPLVKAAGEDNTIVCKITGSVV